MREVKNKDIREAIKNSGLTHWETAEMLGVTEFTFSRWIRKEVSPELKARIFELAASHIFERAGR